MRTLLLPFDRLQPVADRPRLRVVSRRHWAHHVSRALLSAHPFGGLRAATASRFDLLPFQLEPALAMLRHGCLRVLIADQVGLGKTIQAGIILNELTAADPEVRAIIVTPAGVRNQWREELASRFSLSATLADTSWLAEAARDLPADVNPWGLPGIYIASLDLVKRPEVLRALDDVTWDLAVVDEVHSAGVGTARLAAAQAIGARSRRLVLLTATPPDGDPPQLRAICDIGSIAAGPPMTEFRRSRADAGLTARRKSILQTVRLSAVEQRLHRLLEQYTSLLWREASARQDARGRLAAMVLRKRALSSATSLALSVRRRLALLTNPPSSIEQQLVLPLQDEDGLDDQAPDDLLDASGLADGALERRCLEQIITVAEEAGRIESKLRRLLRLLKRIDEPAIVFTEYRDTLAQIAGALGGDSTPMMLHGGLTPRERTGVQRAFNRSGGLLLATDAASEGLSLHERCRLVIHFELPWTPMRLEQRIGRVDRVGQQRTVHEFLLVAHDTAERLVLAPLLRRMRSAAARRGGPPPSLSESAVAAALMDGVPIEPPDHPASTSSTRVALEADAHTESRRLMRLRALSPGRGAVRAARSQICVTDGRGAPPGPLLIVVSVRLLDRLGRSHHVELVPVSVRLAPPRTGRLAREVMAWASAFIERHGGLLLEEARGHAIDSCTEAMVLVREHAEALASREKAVAAGKPSAAQPLVQAGLFDRRALNQAVARRQAVALLTREATARLASLEPDGRLWTDARIIAIRSGWQLPA